MALRGKRKPSPKSRSKKTSTRPPTAIAKSKRPSTPKKAKSKAKKKKTTKKAIGTCFVLMPFKEPFDSYYGAIIRPAVVAAGLEPLRGDSLFRPSPIMADIWAMIQNAKVLVAELTEKNANVFYELGLGHAVGKPIVLMSETIEDVPFDLQPLRVILYDKDDPAWGLKLRGSLTAALSETIDDPTNAVPSMFRKIVKSQAPEESKTAARLSSLEQQLASLELSNRLTSAGPPIRTLSEFRKQVRFATSRQNAADITNSAMRSGVPRALVKSELREEYGPTESRKILALADAPMAVTY